MNVKKNKVLKNFHDKPSNLLNQLNFLISIFYIKKILFGMLFITKILKMKKKIKISNVLKKWDPFRIFFTFNKKIVSLYSFFEYNMYLRSTIVC